MDSNIVSLKVAIINNTNFRSASLARSEACPELRLRSSRIGFAVGVKDYCVRDAPGGRCDAIYRFVPALDSECMVILPIAVLEYTSKMKEGFNAYKCPFHARLLAAVFNDIPACTFDNSCRNGPTVLQIFVVLHGVQVLFEIGG